MNKKRKRASNLKSEKRQLSRLTKSMEKIRTRRACERALGAKESFLNPKSEESGRSDFVAIISGIMTVMTVVALFFQSAAVFAHDRQTVHGEYPVIDPPSPGIIADETETMEDVVLKYNKLFQSSIVTNWDPYSIDGNFRCSLLNETSEIGISISSFNIIDDWIAIKNDGVGYALIRIGGRGYDSGKIYDDDKFKDHMSHAVECGIKVGCFFVSQAVNQVEADEEVEKIIQNVSEYKKSLEYPIGIMLDRRGRTANMTDQEYITIVKYMCIKLVQSGYTPMIMGGESLFQHFPEGIFDGYLKLVSIGDTAPTDINNCIIWEYNDNADGVVQGVNGAVELSVSCYGLLD